MPVSNHDGKIPTAICSIVGRILGDRYYNHTMLNALFEESGAPGEPPPGNCIAKCTEWLKCANEDPGVDAYQILGRVLKSFMEDWPDIDKYNCDRIEIKNMLARYGLSYHSGGRILGAAITRASKDLESIIRTGDTPSLKAEFDRAFDSLETDPAAAVTAACSIFESFCIIYIEREQLSLPSKRTAKNLWRSIQPHLDIGPGSVVDDDIKRILSGLASVVDGVASLRTHAGSAHGRGKSDHALAPFHARLAVNASHSLIIFLMELWQSRQEMSG